MPKPIRAIRHPKSILVKNETEFYKKISAGVFSNHLQTLQQFHLKNLGPKKYLKHPIHLVKLRQGREFRVEKNVCRFEELARARNAAF